MRKQILVIGLKTFGMSIVKQLSKYNCEILAIDKEMDRVEAADEYATHAMQVDIRNADEIAVVLGGEITERGTHEELIAKGGKYKDLYALQFRDNDYIE
jgi:Zn-dependent alcohol dehydrogenase